jgi:hypothetical protein
VTRVLEAGHRGEPHAAGGQLPLVYAELGKLASSKFASEKPGALDSTALVHEAYLRLEVREDGEKGAGGTSLWIEWEGIPISMS